jgi:uncharacterized membrane protein
MAQALDEKETIDLQELLMSIIFLSKALINLLDRKGLVSKQELLEEIKKIQASMLKADK